MSTPRHSHISALHHQAARGREIILAENPQLHLVWRHDKIFIKPIPKYLVSHAFWQYLVLQPSTDDVQKAILGFMRSYSYLIRYESDFDLAQSRGLIPKTDGPVTITWEAFAKFIATFDKYHDVDVSPRYINGELRLTRLNYCTRLFLGKLTFHHMDAQWSTYLTRLLAPLLTAFAIASIILNAMQVELAVQSVQGLENSWNAFIWTSRWFSVVILLMVGLVSGFMIGMMIFMFFHDIWFAWEILRKKNKPNSDAWETKKSGII